MSSVLISPGGILFKHCSIILKDCLISSTRHRYLKTVLMSILYICLTFSHSIQNGDLHSLEQDQVSNHTIIFILEIPRMNPSWHLSDIQIQEKSKL
jgi:hypothetical protein